MPDDTRNDRN